MRRNETLLHLARIMEACNTLELPCECAIYHYGKCIDEMADNVIVILDRLLNKPEIRSCRIPLVINFDLMTDADYWLTSKIFSVLPAVQSKALKRKMVLMANKLKKLQLKIRHVDEEYAEKFFKRMMSRLVKSINTLDYEIWRTTHPHPTMKQLEQQQVQLTANTLMKGVLAYADIPSGDEIAEVRVDLLKKKLQCNQHLSDDFVVECAKLKRYSYWSGNHLFMIDYNKIYTYLFSQCFEKLTKKQRIALFEYNVQLKMIHEDMVKLIPELAMYLKQPLREAPSIAPKETGEELFHFIHPSVDSSQEILIHNEVKRLVKRQGVQEICLYLYKMSVDSKALLPLSPTVAYVELVRMGMPDGEGFSEKTFQKYYKRNNP